MNIDPKLSSAYTRSASNLNHVNQTDGLKNKKKTTLQKISHFLKDLSTYFRGLFPSFSRKSTSATQLNLKKEANTLNINSKINLKRDLDQSSALFKSSIENKLSQTEFGSLDNLYSTLSSLKLGSEISQLTSIIKSGTDSDLKSFDQLLTKVKFHKELSNVHQFISNDSTMKSLAVERLKVSIASIDVSASNLSELNNIVNTFKSELKTELTSPDSFYKTQLNDIKSDVLKSTETYVKSGEFDHKRLVASLYQSSTQLIDYAVGKRKSTIIGYIQKYEPSLDSTQVLDKFNSITNLYTEKHFHLTASTLQGDQYIKGWNTGGRPSQEIMTDIHGLLGGNADYLNDISRSYDSLLDGLNHTIPGSSQALVDAAYQNDTMIACMKTIHEMTLGFDAHIDSLASKDFTQLTLDTLARDVKRTNDIMTNFKALSTDFVVGEKSLTHLTKPKVEQMIQNELSNTSFKDDGHKARFVSKMTTYVLNRLEYKGAIDSEANEYGTIHKESLNKLTVKNSELFELDEFNVFDKDKTKTIFGSVTERGPFSRGFKALQLELKNKLIQHFQNPSATASLKDLNAIISDIVRPVDFTQDGIDRRTDVVELLIKYTDSLLKKEGIIATGDAGLIKELQPRGYLNTQTNFVLKSNKSDFLTSDFYREFKGQFDTIAPSLDQKFNDFLRSGINQGQAGKLRGLVKELKSRPRQWLTENVSFKKEVLKNRFKSLISSEPSSDQTALMQEAYAAKTNLAKLTDDSVQDPEKALDKYESTLTQLDIQASDQLNKASDTSTVAIDEMNKQMTQIQSHIDNIINSKFNQDLTEAQGNVNSRDSTVQDAADSLTGSVSSVESELQALRQILVDSGHVALDKVDDILMSVPYVGEIYSAVQMVNDVRLVGSSQLKMDANQSKFNTVTGFNRYVVTDSSTSQVRDNVAVFSTFLQAEQKRDAAAFSLLVHVGNALSPPGINVGSVLKTIKDVVSLPDLSPEDMDKISQQVVTVNQNYTALASIAKSSGLTNVIASLDSGKLEDFTTSIYDVSTHLPDANDFLTTLDQSLFMN